MSTCIVEASEPTGAAGMRSFATSGVLKGAAFLALDGPNGAFSGEKEKRRLAGVAPVGSGLLGELSLVAAGVVFAADPRRNLEKTCLNPEDWPIFPDGLGGWDPT